MNRSIPIDQPAYGGAPNRKESMYSLKSFRFIPFISSLFSRSSGMWIRCPPELISIPLYIASKPSESSASGFSPFGIM